MSKEIIERVIREEAGKFGLALLTRKNICRLAGVKAGSYVLIMRELFKETIVRMEREGLPMYIEGVGTEDQPVRVMYPAIRKALILEAALRLCRTKLWARLTRVEIAREAGVSASLIPHYFGSMDELRDTVELEAVRKGVPLLPERRRF